MVSRIRRVCEQNVVRWQRAGSVGRIEVVVTVVNAPEAECP
jgi:hypothetical protein